MSQSNPQSLARILLAPWQQRLNTGGARGIALVLALCLAAPVILFAWSLLGVPDQQAVTLRSSARASFWVGIGALLVAGWATFVGNVLQQNHPTHARLVPHHAGQLRLGLLVGWALVSLAAALPGFAFDAPLAWACGAAASLALLAAALRWPLIWLAGIAAPFVIGGVMHFVGAVQLRQALVDAWVEHHLFATCFVAVAGAAVLVQAVRGGGVGHAVSYETRRRLHAAVLAQQVGGNVPVACSRFGWIMGLAVDGRPYAWWLSRLLASPRSSVMARLLVGLGPSSHWTTRIFQAGWFVALSLGLCVVVSLILGPGMLAYVLPWLAFSVLTGLCSPALQAVPQLQQTRREQALLALLPGVPRGARLNRWLAWQMSAAFVVAAVAALLLAWLLDVVADAIQPGVAASATGGMSFGVAAVMLPQVAWQWRHWARLRGATGGVSQVPTLAPIVLGIGVMALHVGTGASYVAMGVVTAIAAAAYCAWRWWRMGNEETAFPVGRLS